MCLIHFVDRTPVLAQRTGSPEVPRVLPSATAPEKREPWKGTGMHLEPETLPTLWLLGNR